MLWILVLIALCVLGMMVVFRAMLDELLSRVEALEGGDKKHAA
jgi:hypothetical protein